MLQRSYRSEIWQASRQRYCRCACQISERLKKSKPESRGFATSRDLAVRRSSTWWIEAQENVRQIDSLSFSQEQNSLSTRGPCSRWGPYEYLVHLTLYGTCDYLPMLGLKSVYVKSTLHHFIPSCHLRATRKKWSGRSLVTGRRNPQSHYNDVIMDSIASQITSLTIVYSAVYLGANQRKHQSSASLAFVRGIHRSPA